jgi:hypothetical protein
MKILFNDILQKTTAPVELLSPALSDYYWSGRSVTIDLQGNKTINAIGIGGTDATVITVNGITINYSGAGLYEIPEITTGSLTVTWNGIYMGRLAAGKAWKLGTSIAKQLAFTSTAEPRTTLSLQVIPGRGGFNYRRVSVDTRYKIDMDCMNDIASGAPYTALGYPFFLLFDCEYPRRLPWQRMYAVDKDQQDFSFESSINKSFFSRRFEFEERF